MMEPDSPRRSTFQLDLVKIIHSLFKIFKEPESKESPNEVKLSLHQLLQIRPHFRTKKDIKSIRAQMRQLECFKKNSFQNLRAVSRQLIEISKRQTEVIIQLISPFATVNHYWQGQLIEVCGTKRDRLRIVMEGEIHLFEPVNHKSYKNCLLKDKNSQYDLSPNIQLIKRNGEITKQNKKSAEEKEKQDDKKQQGGFFFTTAGTMDSSVNPLTGKSQEGNLLKISKQSLLNKLGIQQAKQTLSECNIHSVFSTPHRYTGTIGEGQIVASVNNPTFMNQKSRYQLSGVCSTECSVMEIDFNVTAEICAYLNNDQEKPYIKALLMKFEHMSYEHARQYVSKDLMIEKHLHQQKLVEQEKQKQLQLVKRKQQYEDQFDDQQRALIEKNKEEINNFHYQLPYDGRIYFIVEGQVTLQITKHFEKRFTLLQFAQSNFRRVDKQLVKLFAGDLFGFQEIGKETKYNLKYIIKTDSKILMMDQKIMDAHFGLIFRYETEIQSLIKYRNQMINTLVDKMQKSLDLQQISRHIMKKTNLSPEKWSPHQIRVNEIQYYGKKSFQKMHGDLFNNGDDNESTEMFSSRGDILPEIQESKIKNKKSTPELVSKVQLGIQFSRNFLYNEVSENIKIENGIITVRKPNGQLKRKSFLSTQLRRPSMSLPQYQSAINSPRASKSKEQQDKILRKIGLLDIKQMVQHNFQVMLNRKSSPLEEDYDKQRKQLKRIQEKTKSLPKLGKLYAKKQDLLFRIYQKKHQL